MIPEKALSLKQPWAWAIFHGKDVENRKWNTKFRGSFWVHTTKCSKAYYEEAKAFIEARGLVVPAMEALPVDAIIGSARIYGVSERSPDPLRLWHMPYQYGFLLADQSEISESVPCKGALNFWTVPPEVLEKLAGVHREGCLSTLTRG